MIQVLLLLFVIGFIGLGLEFLLSFDADFLVVGAVAICVAALSAVALDGEVESRGAVWMGWWEKLWFLSSRNNGFVVDGKHRRLSLHSSYRGAMTIAPMGGGKSTTHVIPTILKMAEQDVSLVISDTSGELYNATSGYLEQQGYNLLVFNLMNPKASARYNPLADLSGYTSVALAANVILRSSDSSQEVFWRQGAERCVRILIQCLRNRNTPEHCNLANLRHLLANFDTHRKEGESAMNRFIVESTLTDETTYSDFKGFAYATNERTMQSFLATASTALAPIANPDIASLTAEDTLELKTLREEKSALFVCARQHDMAYYQFVLNLLYAQLCDFLISDLAATKRPVVLLLDEFAHLNIPNFPVFSSVCRKYRVATWILIQSYAQLESRYGEREARAIRDALGTELYMAGVGLETAQELEQRLGKVKVPIGNGDPPRYREHNLLDASEIIRMGEQRVLMLHGTKRPALLSTTPFYEQRKLREASILPPVPLPEEEGSVSYLNLG